MITMMEGNKRAYERSEVAERYAITHLQNAEALIFAKYASQVVGKRILDLGCGGGRTAFFLTQLSCDYVGIDYSERMIDVCGRRFPENEFHVCDARDLSRFKDRSFDFVLFSFNGLDYVDHEGRLKALSEIHRVMDDRGLFVFSSHNVNCGDKDSVPRMEFCYNPRRLAGNAARYLRQMRNRKSLVEKVVHTPDYSIINDPGVDWSLLTYYISVSGQVNQASRAGFEIIDIWDCEGHRLDRHDESCKATWVYYVAAKVR